MGRSGTVDAGHQSAKDYRWVAPARGGPQHRNSRREGKVPAFQFSFQKIQLRRRARMGRARQYDGCLRGGRPPQSDRSAPGPPLGQGRQKTGRADRNILARGVPGGGRQRPPVNNVRRPYLESLDRRKVKYSPQSGIPQGPPGVPGESGAVERDPIDEQDAAARGPPHPGERGNNPKRAFGARGLRKGRYFGAHGAPQSGVDFFENEIRAPPAKGPNRLPDSGGRRTGPQMAGFRVDHPCPRRPRRRGAPPRRNPELRKEPPLGQRQGGVSRSGQIVGQNSDFGRNPLGRARGSLTRLRIRRGRGAGGIGPPLPPPSRSPRRHRRRATPRRSPRSPARTSRIRG